MLQLSRRFAARAVAGTSALVASGFALATPPVIDTTALEGTISSGSAPINAIGLAVLGVLALIVIFKLVRRAM